MSRVKIFFTEKYFSVTKKTNIFSDISYIIVARCVIFQHISYIIAALVKTLSDQYIKMFFH